MTSKQRAYLRSLAVKEETILTVGKAGLGPEIICQAQEALHKRELIKGRVLPETCPVSPREAAEEIAAATHSQVVQVIGSRFVLYKRNHKEPKIQLPKPGRQGE